MSLYTPSSSISWNNNFGPLTTTAGIPASCFMNYQNGEKWLSRAQSCTSSKGYANLYEDDPACWPSRTDAVPTDFSIVSSFGYGFYSPGLMCPGGYSTACSYTGGLNSAYDFFFQFPPDAAETAYGCCPQGFVCTSNGGQSCVSLATSTELMRHVCDYGQIGPPGALDLPSTSTYGPESYQVDTISTATIYAPMIQILHRLNDLSSLATPTSGSSAVPTSTISPTTTSRISSGAVAGIAIGSSAAAISLLAAAAYCFLSARKRKRYGAMPDENEHDHETLRKPGIDRDDDHDDHDGIINRDSQNGLELGNMVPEPAGSAIELHTPESSVLPKYIAETDGKAISAEAHELYEEQHYSQKYGRYESVELQ